MKKEKSKIKAQSSKADQTGSAIAPRWWESGESDALVLRDAGPAETHPWDLLERTAVFGERIVRFTKKVPRNPTNDRLTGQLAGSGTSVGANYCEANEAVSKKDFRCCLGRCVKEAKEAKFFLRMIVASEPQLADEARPLYREAHELLCILASIRKKSPDNEA